MINSCVQLYVGRIFSIMHCCWRNEPSKSSINLLKIEVSVKLNYKYALKNIYALVLKKKDSLSQQSQKVMFLISNNEPKLTD